MRLTNAPGTFQNIMNNVVRDVIGKFVIVYLDDIVVYSKSKVEHYRHLEIVLSLLRNHELYANLAKCKFVQPELHFLGHIVGADHDGLQVDPWKVAIVKDWPVPKDRTALQKFWGLANYFRKFIMGWASLVSALQLQLKRDDAFEWNNECDAALADIKHALCKAPVLALPDLNRPFEVVCDACNCGVGVGAVLLQDGRPVAFDGKRLSPAEQNYSVGEQELLAVIHALEMWRCYLDGTDFTVVTDHNPNTFFASKAVLSPRQTCWAERLSRFQFTWEYRPGRVNVADTPLLQLRKTMLTNSHLQLGKLPLINSQSNKSAHTQSSVQTQCWPLQSLPIYHSYHSLLSLTLTLKLKMLKLLLLTTTC